MWIKYLRGLFGQFWTLGEMVGVKDLKRMIEGWSDGVEVNLGEFETLILRMVSGRISVGPFWWPVSPYRSKYPRKIIYLFRVWYDVCRQGKTARYNQPISRQAGETARKGVAYDNNNNDRNH